MSRLVRNEVCPNEKASTRIIEQTQTPAACSKKLRTELRRVMSDRVFKITRCSQQQNVEKIKQRLNSSNSLTGENAASACASPLVSASQQAASTPLMVHPNRSSPVATTPSPISLKNLSPPSLNKANKISLQPIRTFGKYILILFYLKRAMIAQFLIDLAFI
jgi:hypothetical protein